MTSELAIEIDAKGFAWLAVLYAWLEAKVVMMQVDFFADEGVCNYP